MNGVKFEAVKAGSYFFIDEKIAKIAYHTSDQSSPQLSVGYKFVHDIGALPANVFWTSLKHRIQGIILNDEFLKALGFVRDADKLYLLPGHENVRYDLTLPETTRCKYMHQLQAQISQQYNIALKLDMKKMMA